MTSDTRGYLSETSTCWRRTSTRATSMPSSGRTTTEVESCTTHWGTTRRHTTTPRIADSSATRSTGCSRPPPARLSNHRGWEEPMPTSEPLAQYAVVLGSELLAKRLFGERLEALAAVPGRLVLPIVTGPEWSAHREALADVEVLITGWGTPELTESTLEKMPRLRAVVHAGGSAAPLLPTSMHGRIRVSAAAEVNAIPVAEYTLAMVLLASKQVFHSSARYRAERCYIDREVEFPHAGNFGQTVGIVGSSRIGRRVIELLAPFDLRILVYDPFLDDASAAALGVETVSLAELFRASDVVSLHAPLTGSTQGMVGARQLALMKTGATLINTARGGLVDHEALERELLSSRLFAILDVTDPF